MKYFGWALVISALILPYASAGYNETLGKEFANVAIAGGCYSDQLINLTCGDPCEWLKQNGYNQTFFAKTYELYDMTSLAFSIFYNPTKNLLAIDFRGTIGPLELVEEILQTFGTLYTLHKIAGNPLVQDYFYTRYVGYIRDDLISTIKKAKTELFTPDTTVVFTGHSLGAALTIHSAFDAKLEGLLEDQKVLVYVYGCPRVGNADFTDLFNSLFPESHRIVHYRDIVARIPPCVPEVSTGKCIKSNWGEIFWYPYHINHEVYYSEGMELGNFTVCEDEDPNCQNQYSLFEGSVDNHHYYFGKAMGCIPFFLEKKNATQQLPVIKDALKIESYSF